MPLSPIFQLYHGDLFLEIDSLSVKVHIQDEVRNK